MEPPWLRRCKSSSRVMLADGSAPSISSSDSPASFCASSLDAEPAAADDDEAPVVSIASSSSSSSSSSRSPPRRLLLLWPSSLSSSSSSSSCMWLPSIVDFARPPTLLLPSPFAPVLPSRSISAIDAAIGVDVAPSIKSFCRVDGLDDGVPSSAALEASCANLDVFLFREVSSPFFFLSCDRLSKQKQKQALFDRPTSFFSLPGCGNVMRLGTDTSSRSTVIHSSRRLLKST